MQPMSDHNLENNFMSGTGLDSFRMPVSGCWRMPGFTWDPSLFGSLLERFSLISTFLTQDFGQCSLVHFQTLLEGRGRG